MRIRLYRMLSYIFVASTLLLQGSCVRNPVTGERQLALISTGQEIGIGQESHPEIVAEYGGVEDPALQEYFS